MKPSQSDSLREYYDDLAGGFLSGYVYGNPRIRSALQFILEWTPADARRILDAGCAIGESTDALKRDRPHAFVLGIDSHERLLGLARRRRTCGSVSPISAARSRTSGT